jgi:hypothetical protein
MRGRTTLLDGAAGSAGSTRAPGPSPTIAGRSLLAVLPLSTGVAVLFYLLTDISLPLTAGVLVLLGAGATAGVRQRLSPVGRRYVAERTKVGLQAGLAATAVYDVARYVIVAVADMSLEPFKTFALFGQTFVGEGASTTTQYAVGTVYHVVNGLGFAVAYTVFFVRPRIATALLWAGVLELATILLYPSWLRLTAMGELATVSVLGHVAYGLTLGVTAKAVMDRRMVRA